MEALKRLRRIIEKRAADPKAKMFGLSDDLRAIGAAFDELERSINVIAAIEMAQHFNQRLSEEQFAVLRGLAPLPPDTKHEPTCMCAPCTAAAMRALERLTRTLT